MYHPMISATEQHSSFKPSQRSLERLMLFDLALGGHHGNYIQHLVDYWCEQNLPGCLEIVVLPEFLEVHRQTVSVLENHQHPDIHLIPLQKAEAERLKPRDSGLNRTLRNFQEWRLYQKYAAARQATQALLMYLDTCELPLTVGMSSPCPFSGIYFRPTFHYPALTSVSPSPKEQRQQQRERFTLARILRHSQLKTLLCLDPFVIKHLDQFRTQASCVSLPDPVQLAPCSSNQVNQLRAKLGIEPDRTIFLLFGAIDARKGIHQLLDAIALLPTELAQRFCLLLVGATSAAEKAMIQPKITARSEASPVQIIQEYAFMSEAEVAAYFGLADMVLAPYQNHVGMSGILLLAAAAGKPVLSSDYGLMGELVRRYELGLSVDSKQPAAICDGLTQLLDQSPDRLGNHPKMLEFAQQNSAQQYAQAIFQSLFSPVSHTVL